MYPKSAVHCIEEQRKDPKPTGYFAGEFVSFVCHAKVKTRDGKYYSSGVHFYDIGPIPEDIVERIPIDAAEQVKNVVWQMDTHGGWWFEDQTIWLSKDEVAMVFADVTLYRADGLPYS